VPIGVLVSVILLGSGASAVEKIATGPNTDPTYQKLRNIGFGGAAIGVSNFDLKRDAATFHLHSGTICFLEPVQGKITGAVFAGEGNLILDPPLPSEVSSLKLLTKENEFSETFSQLVLRFTDSTYDEIKKVGSAVSAGCDAALLQSSQNATRKKLHYNLDARILQDVLGGEPGGLFLAFIHGNRYSDKEVFSIDPQGGSPLVFPPTTPEEEQFVTYADNKTGVWASFHLLAEYKNGTASSSQNNFVIHIEHQQLDTTIEKNGNLIGKAVTTFASQVNGLRVVPFDLFGKLRVQSVTGEDAQPLTFIQEDKKDDPDFAVILPKPLALGEKYTITTSYSGKEAVLDEGSGNYFPVARDNWYPNNAASSLGQYSAYDMTFRIPKGLKMAATGTLVSETTEGEQNVTVWKTEVPQTVAGFNFGKFKEMETKLTRPEYLVQSYANEDPPDWVRSLLINPYASRSSLGTMGTTGLEKKALAEGELSIGLFSDYFGPLPYKHLAMTQQTACNFGQSWPELVFLPICSFFDSTTRHQLGVDFGNNGYWKAVAPHEVAHQWWGHDVGFNGYRDQWMSEGFAEMSASLFIQMIEKDPKKFIEFWDDERHLLTERNKEGFRAIDTAAVTMGYRMSNTRTGTNITRNLIYPKGAYILHMVRMMMWDRQGGDQDFKATMQDFVQTYSGRAATTEDFKAILEKHMTPEMAAFGRGKMDWFFDEYVYGTTFPTYKVQYSFDKDATSDVVLSLKLTQSNVNESFRMLVPIYLEMADGATLFLGRARLTGNTTLEQKIPLKGLKETPHRALVNYYDDVLASAN
jgi:hypothetical protein